MHNSERWIVGALFGAALLAFFFPIASLELPIVGKIEASGYDFLSKSEQFKDRLGTLGKEAPESPAEVRAQQEPSGAPTTPLPISIQTIALLPFEILGTFGLAAFSLFACIVGISRGTAKVSSTLAGALGIGSILHIVIADSDLHTWFQAQMQANANESANNPLAMLAQNIGALVANAVHFRPGAGLYALAVSVSLGALLLHSGLVQGTQATEEDEDQWQGDSGARLFAFTFVAVLSLGAAVFVLRRTVPSQTPVEQARPAKTAPSSIPSTPDAIGEQLRSEATDEDSKSRLVATLTDLSAKQGHNHLYSMCSNDTLCVMDAEAPNDGFMENFTSNSLLAQRLYEAGFRGLIIANGSHAWGWRITDTGFSVISEAQPPSPQPSAPEE